MNTTRLARQDYRSPAMNTLFVLCANALFLGQAHAQRAAGSAFAMHVIEARESMRLTHGTRTSVMASRFAFPSMEPVSLAYRSNLALGGPAPFRAQSLGTETSPAQWLEKPAPGVRGAAQLGALGGVVVGFAIGSQSPCVASDASSCQIPGVLIGAAAGAYTGSVLGAAVPSYSSSSGASSTSQRTLTVIVKFGGDAKVRDFAYHTARF